MTSVTVRIPDELKKEIDTLGVEVSEVTRSALENEVRRIKQAKARVAAENLGKMLANVSDEEIINAIRESRDKR